MSIDLVIDTATDALICGLVSHNSPDFRSIDSATILQEKTIPTSRKHMELLIPVVQEIMCEAHLTENELDSIIVGIGPGPFTGLRVGIASALALAQAWNKPLLSAISLDAIARRALSLTNSKYDHIVALLDARRKEWYVAHYLMQDISLQCVTAPYATSPERLDLSQVEIVCPQKIADQLIDYSPIIYDHPRCLDLWAVAFGDGAWDAIHPIYCRQPDAIPGQLPKKVVP